MYVNADNQKFLSQQFILNNMNLYVLEIILLHCIEYLTVWQYYAS